MAVAALCGDSGARPSDAEVFVGYSGTVVVNPHGAPPPPTPIMNNITAKLGVWCLKADDCTLGMSNDACVLALAGASKCTYAWGDIMSGMLRIRWLRFTGAS